MFSLLEFKQDGAGPATIGLLGNTSRRHLSLPCESPDNTVGEVLCDKNPSRGNDLSPAIGSADCPAQRRLLVIRA